MPLRSHDYVTVRGLRELSSAFRKLSERELRLALPRLMREAATPALAAARAGAATQSASGRLASTVRMRVRTGGVVVGSPLVYAPIIAFGHQAVITGGKVAPHVRRLTPHDWIIDPVEATTPAVERHIEAGISRLLDSLIGNA